MSGCPLARGRFATDHWISGSSSANLRDIGSGVVDVYLLRHIHHASPSDGSPIRHVDDDGDLPWNEEDGDDVKLLGVYSTEQRAHERIREAQNLPGFRDEPNCFTSTDTKSTRTSGPRATSRITTSQRSYGR